MKSRTITLQVNGEAYSLTVPVHKTLLEVLRDDLGMTDTKYGCGTGECGACTVLMDGKTVLSCLTLAATAGGHEVTTAAGLAENGDLHPVQQAFIDEAAMQCGYCTPGLIVKSVGLLNKNTHPTEAEIRRELEGNICRCTGYVKVVRAVQKASEVLTGAKTAAAE